MRTTFFFLGLTALAAGVVAACGGGDNGSIAPPADGGTDAASPIDGSDAGPAPSDASSPDAADANDDAALPEDAGTDAADASDDGDASEAGPAERASTRLAAGAQVVGVTSDNQVVYWAKAPMSASGVLATISGEGGEPQILSSTTRSAVVAGNTVVWLDTVATGFDTGACKTLDSASVRSWSSAHGATQVAPFAVVLGSGLGVTIRNGLQYSVAVNADGSQVAYVPTCNTPALDDDAATGDLSIAIAPTDGSGAPLSAALATPPALAWFYLNGSTAIVEEQTPGSTTAPTQVFGGNPLAVIVPDSVLSLVSPNGAWVWTAATTGRVLVRASDGSVVLTDATAAGYEGAVFDAVGANLFYLSSQGIEQVALGSATPTAVTLAGTSNLCSVLVAAAPNGGALVCLAEEADGGAVAYAITTGATPATFPIPTTDVGFLADSTLAWSNAGTFQSEPTLGGPVVTDATSVASFVRIGGSQIAAFPAGSYAALIVDATGKVPAFALSPTPSNNGLFAPPGGGLVAYATGGSIYAAQTW